MRRLRSSWYISISSVDVACRVEFCRDGPGTTMLTRMILVQEPLDVAVEACTHVSRIDRDYAESPYLARQLSVFDDRQVVIGLPRMMVGGLQYMQNSIVNAETTIYTGSVHRNSVLRPVWGE